MRFPLTPVIARRRGKQVAYESDERKRKEKKIVDACISIDAAYSELKSIVLLAIELLILPVHKKKSVNCIPFIESEFPECQGWQTREQSHKTLIYRASRLSM